MAILSDNHELSALRRICKRGALLLSPFLLLLFADIFVLPVDFFTFRVWEGALATPYRYPGPYYPNLHVTKDKEYGDHYREGDPAKVQAKQVEWFTDAYGFRNRPEIEQQKHYDTVILGDSNIVGSFLDQKDTLAEVVDTRSNKIAYSYSYGSDHISLYFSDPRMEKRMGELLVVESKVGNWSTTNDYLNNFREFSDGSLNIRDRSHEFAHFYDPNRNFTLEKIDSRFTKQAMFHWLRASLATNFKLTSKTKSELFFGREDLLPLKGEPVWHAFDWVSSGGVFKLLPDDLQPALMMRAVGQTFWKTGRFVSSRPDGRIVIRFEARNSISSSPHRLWIFEDGSYRSIGEFIAGPRWKSYEIPVSTNRGSILEFQIDQMDNWQSLSIRDVKVIGGAPPQVKRNAVLAIPMTSWSVKGAPCDGTGVVDDCRQWAVAGKKGYVQTPELPQAGENGLLVRFEARSDRPVTTFTKVYLFEGEKYSMVAQYAFGSEWHKYEIWLNPDQNLPTKFQIDYPNGVGTFSVRNFQAVPIEHMYLPEAQKVAGGAGVTQVQEAPISLAGQVNSSPLFASAQGWSDGYAKARGKAQGKGVVVGPGSSDPSVFAQQFSASAGDHFKVVARASSVDKPETQGRFQVNWLDANNKFISTFIQPFAVSPDEKTFEAYTTAPAGTVLGMLYVVPGGKDMVRYTEMRMLNKNRTVEANPIPKPKAATSALPKAVQKIAPKKNIPVLEPFPKPANLHPLDGSGYSLTVTESQYYFYHATKVLQRRAKARGMDFIMYVMPDYDISRLMPAIKQLRIEGIKVLAYEPQGDWTSGVDVNWFWQKADSHWTEAAVRLTADEIIRMWRTGAVANRPFSTELAAIYSHPFPAELSSLHQRANINKRD